MTGTAPEIPARRVLLPSRDREGRPSSAWLLVQAAQLAIETSWVLGAINDDAGLKLAEERRAQSEAAVLLENAARALVIMESGMPLAAAWADGLPRARSVFARARDAGSDVASVMPDFTLPPKPSVSAEILAELERASREDPEPLPHCTGVTKQGMPCGRKVFKGIGSAHCHDHFNEGERRRRDALEAARARIRDAEDQALAARRELQANWWADRYGRLPARLEVPSAPALTGEADPDEPEIPISAEFRRMALHSLQATGWPDITPRAAEIIRALSDLEYASPQAIAEHALAYAPGHWATTEEWLDSSIWDGYQPPVDHLPPAGTVPNLDEYPGVRELRRRMELDARRLQRWKDGFEALVTACACQPVATMRELMAFWLDIIVLEEAVDTDAGGTRLCIEMSPSSPWVAISLDKQGRRHSQGEDRQVLERAVQFLASFGVPWDPYTTYLAPVGQDVADELNHVPPG